MVRRQRPPACAAGMLEEDRAARGAIARQLHHQRAGGSGVAAGLDVDRPDVAGARAPERLEQRPQLGVGQALEAAGAAVHELLGILEAAGVDALAAQGFLVPARVILEAAALVRQPSHPPQRDRERCGNHGPASAARAPEAVAAAALGGIEAACDGREAVDPADVIGARCPVVRRAARHAGIEGRRAGRARGARVRERHAVVAIGIVRWRGADRSRDRCRDRAS